MNKQSIEWQEAILAQLQSGEISLETAEQILLKGQDEPVTAASFLDQRSKETDIAIIGIACRFSGANDWRALWENLKAGIDSIIDIPNGRWSGEDWYHPDPTHSGTAYLRCGGFLETVDQFDASFFQITPAEAEIMDPQQRIFLEEAYHAIEDAGYAPEQFKGKNCGVFVGVGQSGYTQVLAETGGLLSRFVVTGLDLSILAARIAYFLDLQGPALAIDTACSSSLTAIHKACESIRSGETDLALAGGISVGVMPAGYVQMSQFQMLSPEGRCKTFDATASGFVPGEGCGVLLLKNAAKARQDGDRLYAIIKGSGINQDGSTNGITAPSLRSQVRLEKNLYEKLAINPETIGYVEAHGTGTALGDPIEIAALTEAFSAFTNQRQFCAIGSIKTNIGHTIMAAGVAGVIKAALCLQYGHLVPSLHFNQPNPHIDFANSPFYVSTRYQAWKTPIGRPRRAAVSSFGLSGTNAHMVLEDAPSPPVKRNGVERPYHLLTFSAQSRENLQVYAQRYYDFLTSHHDLDLGDLCYTAHVGRSHFAHRLSLVADSLAGLQQQLATFLNRNAALGLRQGTISLHQAAPKVAFLFTGQGAQYVEMGRQLYATQPTFRAILEQCDQLLYTHLGESIIKVLYPEKDNGRFGDRESRENRQSKIDETRYTQPILFALEYALAQLWRSWGIQPDLLIGHSVGELAAACVAGVFSLEDGLKLVAARGRLMDALPQDGEMISVVADQVTSASIEAYVQKVLAPYPNEVSIAAINSPDSVVISGKRKTLLAIAEQLAAEGMKMRRLTVSHAFHSPLMEPMLADFRKVAASITYHQPKLRLISTVTGKLAGALRPDQGSDTEPVDVASPDYWVRHVRQVVRFADGVETLYQQGCTIFLEIGPKPTLVSLLQQASKAPLQSVMLPSLRENRNDWQQMLESLAELYVRGVNIDWHHFDQEYQRRRVSLPTYPFQPKRYWPVMSSHKAGFTYTTSPVLRLIEEGELEKLVKQLALEPLLAADEKQLVTSALKILIEKHQSFANEKKQYPNDLQRLQQAQLEMSKLLFNKVDFSAYKRVMDLGCGYGTDVITLAEQYPHLMLFGYTVSGAQAQLVAKKIATKKLEERVHVLQADSTKKTFPENLDLIFGIEVAAHIADKDALLRNISEHLNQTGTLLLADYLAHSKFPIEDPKSSMYIVTQQEWIRLLSQHQLKLVSCIDSSSEVINFLHSPFTDTNFTATDETARQAFQAFQQTQHLLSRNMASYVFLRAEKESTLSSTELIELNQRAFDKTTWFVENRPDRWLYQVIWSAQPHAPSRSNPALLPVNQSFARLWVLFVDETRLGQTVAAALQQEGDQTVFVYAGSTYQQLDRQTFVVNPQMRQTFQELLTTITKQYGSLYGVLYLWGAEQPKNSVIESGVAASERGCSGLLHLTQSLLQMQQQSPRLWIVTQNAQPVLPEDSLAGIAYAPLWGMAKVIEAEHPELSCTRIDLDGRLTTDEQANALYDELSLPMLSAEKSASSEKIETQIALRHGERYVARLARFVAQPEPIGAIRPDGSYLITGGLRGIGLLIAQWLVKEGARHILLLGRSQPSSEAQQQIDRWIQQGISITVARADVTDRKQLETILSGIDAMYPLCGVIQAAAVLDDGALLQQDWARFSKVLAPKLLGTWNLHALTQGMKLDFFVLFSSMAGLIGNRGQVNYAAANAFLDAFAPYRQAHQLPGLSINWGAWAEVGAAARLVEQERTQMHAIGLGVIEPEAGLQMFGHLLGQSAAQVGVAPIDWRTYLQWVGSSAFFDELAQSVVLVTDQPALALAHSDAWLIRLAELSEGERLEEFGHYLQQQISIVMRLDVTELDRQQPLISFGIDSLMAVQLRNQIKQILTIEVPVADFIAGASIHQLAAYINDQYGKIQQSDLGTTTSVRGIQDKSEPDKSEPDKDKSARTVRPAKIVEGVL